MCRLSLNQESPVCLTRPRAQALSWTDLCRSKPPCSGPGRLPQAGVDPRVQDAPRKPLLGALRRESPSLTHSTHSFTRDKASAPRPRRKHLLLAVKLGASIVACSLFHGPAGASRVLGLRAPGGKVKALGCSSCPWTQTQPKPVTCHVLTDLSPLPPQPHPQTGQWDGQGEEVSAPPQL